MSHSLMHATHSDTDLVSKYSGNGPRYTSYPTAPQFSEEFPVPEFLGQREMLGRELKEPMSLYLHVPFCRDICYYCACNKVVTRDPQASRRYLDHLQTEIRLQSELHGQQRPIRQMHWGGGSPTYLDHAELTELMHELASHFHLLDQGQREYSIEIDPRTTEANGIALLKGLGFNRVSLGIQDFDPLVQRSINRHQPFAMVASLVDDIRRHGFRSLSFDLIYGLPHQDRQSMSATLRQVLELRPDRIACYNYAHLPERFTSQRSIDRLDLPSPAEKLHLQKQIADILCAAGYRHIGLDHYVLPGDDLAVAQDEGRLQRNFQGYSVQMAQDLLGLGVSAISHLGDFYVQNARSLPEYYQQLERGALPIARGYESNDEDRLRQHVIMQLICNLYLETSDCDDLFDIDFWSHFQGQRTTLEEMAADGLVELDQDCLRVTEEGRPFLRNICMIFDQYLTTPRSAANAPRYSATV